MEYGLVFVWLAAYAALGALALPLAASLFDGFPDDGAGLALPVALAVLGLVGFWVGRVAFGWPALVAGLVVLAGLSAVAVRRGADPDLRRAGEVFAVFVVAFLFLVAVRALDPAVHPGGGEKFLDFGMLSALLRADSLPPEDFWFAGEPVRYYYGGHMVVALLVRLTGTVPRFAYNLALPGFYAAFVTAAYSLAGAVAADRDRSRVSAGLFAAFFVGVASNFATPVRAVAWTLGSRLPLSLAGLQARWAGTLPREFSYWTASRVIPGTVNEFPLFAFLNGDMHAHMMSPPLLLLGAALGYAYWRTPPADLRRRRLFALAVAPVAGLVAVVNTWSFPTVLGVAWLGLALAPGSPLRLVPLVGPRLASRLDAADARAGLSDRLVGEVGRTAAALVVAAVLSVLAAVSVLPFLTGATGGRGVGFVAAENRSRLGHLLVVHGAFLLLTLRFLGGRVVGELTTSESGRSGAVAALVAAGAVVVVALGLTLVVPVAFGVRPRLLGVVPFVLVVAVGWTLVRADASGDGPGYETALLVGAAGLVTLVEFVYVTDTGPGRFNTVFKTYAQVWALSAVAGGIVLAEYADPAGFLARLVPAGDASRRTGAATDGGRSASGDGPGDGADGRSPASAGAETATAGDDGLSGGPPPAQASGGGGPALPSVGGVLAAALVVSLSIYGAFALAGHVSEAEARGPATLDALRFAERDHSAEWPAVQYVRSLEGTPNIVTAPATRMYRWSSDYWVERTPDPATHEMAGGAAPASLSGVPTVAGWAHEIGYRGSETYNARVADVAAIYDGSPSEQARLLAAYDVEYVYVGPAERQRYGSVNLASRLRGVTVVEASLAWEHVTIYRVDQSALGVAGAVEDPTATTDRRLAPGVGPARADRGPVALDR